MKKLLGFTLLELMYAMTMIGTLLIIGYSYVSSSAMSTRDAISIYSSLQSFTGDYARLLRECGVYNGRVFKNYGTSPNPRVLSANADAFLVGGDVNIPYYLQMGTIAPVSVAPEYRQCFKDARIRANPSITQYIWNFSPDPGDQVSQSFILNGTFKMEINSATGSDKKVCWKARYLPYDTVLQLVKRYSMNNKNITALAGGGDSSDPIVTYSHTSTIDTSTLINKTTICFYDF